jgi:hypothetical protein
MARHKDSGYTIIETGLFMRVTGPTIFRVDRESRFGLIAAVMKGSTSWGRNMGKVLMSGLTAATTLALGRITTFMDTGSIFGVMGEAIKGNGVSTKCTVMECISGKMGGAMKENTIMIRSTASGSISGQMGAVSRGTG